MKKILSVMLCVVMLLSSSLVYADYGQNSSEDLTDFEYAKSMLSEMMEINKILKPCGLTLEDLRSLPTKDQAFYDELKELLIAESNSRSIKGGVQVDWEAVFNTSNTSEISEESKNDADMWGYAWQMAELNKQRDPNAKDIYQEAKYMYLSHYVDIKSGPRYYVDSSISNDSYFSAWITNSDRTSYDTYLNGTGIADEMMETSKAFVNTINLIDSARSVQSLDKIRDLRWYVDNVCSFISIENAGSGLSENFDDFSQILEQEDNPVNFVNRLRSTLELEDYDDLKRSTIEATFLAIVVGAFGSGISVVPFVTAAYSFYSYAFKDFYDKVWWIALIQYNNIRVSNRIVRYYGM